MVVEKKAAFDPDFEIVRITHFLKSQLESASAKGYVVGLSGGIDSAVVASLCQRAVGGKNVLCLRLFEDYYSKSQDFRDAGKTIKQLGARSIDIPISPLVDAFEATLKSKKLELGRVTLGNIKARLRMVLLYAFANQEKYLVAGTGDRSEDLVGFFCYDERTTVVTNNGLKEYQDLRKGDLVYSLDTISGCVVESPVEDVFVFDYSGEMIYFRSDNADLMVTPNHRMLVCTSTGDPTYNYARFRTAEECLKRKYTVIPIPKGWMGKPGLPTHVDVTFSQKHLKRTVSFAIEDVFYILGLFIGDGCAVRGRVTVPVVSGISRQEYQSMPRNKQGQFAILASDIRSPQMRTYDIYETDFALPIPDKNEARNHLIQLLRKYGIGFSLTHDLVRIPSKGLYDFFSQCGIGARDKYVPRWILDYPSNYLSFLLAGLMDSDGTHSDKLRVYFTSSKRLKDDFVELCIKLGRIPTVRQRDPRLTTLKNGKSIRTSSSYEISYAASTKPSRWITNSRAKKVNYTGKVWCPSVPPRENLLVHREGRYVFSGNTKYGDGGVDNLPIAHLYKGQVRELGRRLGVPKGVITKPSSPNLWKGHKATDEIPADYTVLDPILSLIFDHNLGPVEVNKQTHAPLSLINEVIKRNLGSRHKRSYPPMVVGW